MARLPQPGADTNTWGDILNDFLGVAHNPDGTLKDTGLLAAKADDSAVVHNAGDETVAGVKTFSSSPVVPTPTILTQAATKGYVDSAVSAGTPDATTTNKGIVQLSGDLGGTATAPTVPGLATKAAKGANADITSLSGLTTPLSVGQGGTGANTLTGIVTGNGTSAFTTVAAPAGGIVGTTDTQTLSNKALTSPVLTGSPTAPTPTSGDSSTTLATTAFVQQAVAGTAGSRIVFSDDFSTNRLATEYAGDTVHYQVSGGQLACATAATGDVVAYVPAITVAGFVATAKFTALASFGWNVGFSCKVKNEDNCVLYQYRMDGSPTTPHIIESFKVLAGALTNPSGSVSAGGTAPGAISFWLRLTVAGGSVILERFHANPDAIPPAAAQGQVTIAGAAAMPPEFGAGASGSVGVIMNDFGASLDKIRCDEWLVRTL
jgi:hypothetical protein